MVIGESLATIKGPRGKTGPRGLPGLDAEATDPGVATYVDAGLASATGRALDGVFRPRDGQELRTARAAYARRDLDILVVGDSISEGTGPTKIENRYASRLRDLLRRSAGLTGGGRGYVPAMYAVNPPAPDELWALAGGATEFVLNRGLGKRAVRLNGAGHAATLTVPAGHTDVDILVTCDLTMTSWLTRKVDGVAGANINVQSLSSATLRDVVIPIGVGLDPSMPHTIEIGWGSGNVYLSGAMLYAAGEKAGGVGSGVRLWDGSHHGKGSEWFANAADPWNYTIDTVQPDVVVIALGRNNWSGGTRTPAQVAADIEALIGSIHAHTNIAPSLVIVSVYGNKAAGAPVAPWADYVTAQRDLADAHGAAHLDLTRTLGTMVDAATNELGILTPDFVHPSDIGSQMIADELLGLIVP